MTPRSGRGQPIKACGAPQPPTPNSDSAPSGFKHLVAAQEIAAQPSILQRLLQGFCKDFARILPRIPLGSQHPPPALKRLEFQAVLL